MIPEIVRQRLEGNDKSQDEMTILSPKNANSDKKCYTHFAVFDMPTEIRNMIYEHVVSMPDKTYFLDNASTPALALVCKRLRKEVLPVFLSTNSFHIVLDKTNGTVDPTTGVKDIAFNIRPETRAFLQNLGSDSPLFTSLTIHFGTSSRTRLVLECTPRQGVTLKHEDGCRFCHPLPDHPALPAHLVTNEIIHRIIDLNDQRMTEVGIEHANTVADLKNDLFGEGPGKIDDKATAFSLDDIYRLERGLNSGIAAFALAVHTINMSRLLETPLLINMGGVLYSLRQPVARAQ